MSGADITDGQLDIYDMQGKKVLSAPFTGTSCKLNTGMLSTGIYLLKIRNKHGSLMARGKLSVE
jgi:hypothetical protein